MYNNNNKITPSRKRKRTPAPSEEIFGSPRKKQKTDPTIVLRTKTPQKQQSKKLPNNTTNKIGHLLLSNNDQFRDVRLDSAYIPLERTNKNTPQKLKIHSTNAVYHKVPLKFKPGICLFKHEDNEATNIRLYTKESNRKKKKKKKKKKQPKLNKDDIIKKLPFLKNRQKTFTGYFDIDTHYELRGTRRYYPGQNQVMQYISAYEYVKAVKPNIVATKNWQWLHVIAFGLGGSQHEDNLVAGTWECNRLMMAFESATKQLISHEILKELKIENKVSYLEYKNNKYTRIAEKINYKIYNKNDELIFKVNFYPTENKYSSIDVKRYASDLAKKLCKKLKENNAEKNKVNSPLLTMINKTLLK